MSSQSTRSKLLAAASAIFAEKGFEAATLSAITERAGTNIAAINYHFGDKASFYAEVIVHQINCATGPMPGTDAHAAVTPEDRLREIVRWFVRRVGASAHGSPLSHIAMQEMARPSPILDRMVEMVIRPELTQIQAVIRMLLPDDATDDTVRRFSLSVVAQCVFYRHAWPIISRVFPGFELDESEQAALAEHVANVCLASLADERERAAQRSPHHAS